MSNAQTVQDIYAAFGRGDVPTILGLLVENVDWDYGIVDAGVPWMRPRKGVAEVAKFFESLAALDFQKFLPKTIVESGNIVIALIDVAFTVKATGRALQEEDEVHIFQFDDHGKVVRFCHRVDTHNHWLAFRGE